MVYTIKAPCCQNINNQGVQFGPNEIKEHYDFELEIEDFNGSKVEVLEDIYNINFCNGYQKLYDHIYNNIENDEKILTIGGDGSISAATIPAIKEKYKDVVVLWIDNELILKNIQDEIQGLDDLTFLSLLGELDQPFINKDNKTIIQPEDIICLGVKEDDDNLQEKGITYFTLEKIKNLNLNNILDYIKTLLNNRKIHICLNIGSLNKDLFSTNYEEGLSKEDIEIILKYLKGDLIALDIIGFNPISYNNEDVKKIREFIRNLIKEVFDLKEKSINIFTEHSYFLIYRPVEQERGKEEEDIGWYLLRGLDKKLKNEIMSKLDDEIIETINIDGKYYMITKTTMDYQNKKSYYDSKNVFEAILFPEEKKVAGFELIN